MKHCDLDKMKDRGEAPEWVIRKDNRELIKEVEQLRRLVRSILNTKSMSELRRVSIQIGDNIPKGSDRIDV